MDNANNFFDPSILKRIRDKGIHLNTNKIEKDRDKREEENSMRFTKEYLNGDRSDIFKSSLIGNKESLKQTFDDFQVMNDNQNKELEQTLSIAARIANGEKHKFIFYGKPGTGKTMLAISILNKLKSDYSCLFVDIAMFIELTKNFKDERAKLRVNSLYKAMSNADVLVIDDLGSESSMQRNATEASTYNQRVLFNIAQSRDDKTTIITTNNSGSELKQIYNQKLISKLMNTEGKNVISFDSEDYRRNKN